MTTVVVAGALASKEGSAGEAWVRMSWVRGLQQLGLDVWFAEQAGDDSGRAWFESVVARFGLEGRAALLTPGAAFGALQPDDLRALAAQATLVNISGNLDPASELFAAFRRRVLVDIDPGFTQFWHAEGLAGARVAGHDLHFTIGELIGSERCPIPTGGIDWIPTRQPVVLGDWPLLPPAAPGRFTTVGNWRGPYGPVVHEGVSYGLKVHEFRRFLELPSLAQGRFELALEIHPADAADRAALVANGWELADPQAVAGDPDAFRDYVQRSGGEFSVAQGVYVGTRCGWFSDRSTRYLASGRPVLVQDTGFGELIPAGTGVVAFHDLASAAAGAADIAARYDEHAAAARAIAEEHFAAERVLARFCERAGIG